MSLFNYAKIKYLFSLDHLMPHNLSFILEYHGYCDKNQTRGGKIIMIFNIQ